MSNSVNMVHVEMIHNHLYADTYQNNGDFSTWAYMLERAIRIKDFRYLTTVLAHGKGFNDQSKEIFCDIIKAPRKYLKRQMSEYISRHCVICQEKVDLHFDTYAAKDNATRRMEELLDAFANGSELVEIVNSKIADGFVKTEKHGRKTFLVHEERQVGWPLERVQIKNYAIAQTEYLQLKSRYDAVPEFQNELSKFQG